MRLDQTDFHILPRPDHGLGCLEHAICFSHTGAYADIDFKLSHTRFPGQVEIVLGFTVQSFIHGSGMAACF
jgi:hypothetical protein